MIDDGTQMEAGAPNPVAECCPVQCYPLSGVDFGLAVERDVVTELGHHDLRDERFSRQAAGHDMFRSMSLDHRPGATPASVFRTAGDDHTELSRYDVQSFGDILADLAISPQPQGQSVVPGSMTRSIRGRCFGR